MGIRHFRFMVEGGKLTFFTDHKPFTSALGWVMGPWTAQQCRHLVYQSGFSSDVKHIAWSANNMADTLTWPLGRMALSQRPGVAACKTAPYFYGSILPRALKSKIIVVRTYIFKK
jgi:hypothetical protein